MAFPGDMGLGRAQFATVAEESVSGRRDSLSQGWGAEVLAEV